MSGKIDIIQQWQYAGSVEPDLLDDSVFEKARKMGITALQSYVIWSVIEPEEGRIDFSSYDPIVEKCRKHGLDWVPFIILGPNYSVPEWYHASKSSVYATCLEHGISSRIQSIWNPDLPRRVERLIQLIAERYRNANVIQSVLLGISGNWGETLYPISGCFRPGFHTHLGWWCNESYALASYQEYLQNKYFSIGKLRRAHGRLYKNFGDIRFPTYTYNDKNETGKFNTLKKHLRQLINKSQYIGNRILRNRIFEKKRSSSLFKLFVWRPWFDFTSWYTASMTSWCEKWIITARKFFPQEKLYLVTGGEGWLEGGAVFSEQIKIAKKYDCGIRITNQSNTFADSFVLARLVSSSARFYKTYYHTEEAWINTSDGVTARIYDAAISGADGFYCKNLIGTGFDICTKKEFPIGQLTGGAANLTNYANHITGHCPNIEVAVLFPSTSIAFGTQIFELLNVCRSLRQKFDYDLIDEIMIQDGALKNYRFIIIPYCKWMRGETIDHINKWVLDGGIIIQSSQTHINNIDRPGFNVDLLKSESSIERYGEGFCFSRRIFDLNEHNNYCCEMILNKINAYPYKGINFLDLDSDGIYSSIIDNHFLVFNETDQSIDGEYAFRINNIYGKIHITMSPHSISAIAIPS